MIYYGLIILTILSIVANIYFIILSKNYPVLKKVKFLPILNIVILIIIIIFLLNAHLS